MTQQNRNLVQQALARAANANAAANSGRVPANTSAMPATGLACWAPYSEQGLPVVAPTDNQGANTSNLVGVYSSDGFLTRAGAVANARMTTDGGKPGIGVPVYLAAALDDGGTAAGKMTPKRPTLGVIGRTYPRNVARVGVCTDNSNYDAEKTCVVDFSGSGEPEPQIPPRDQAWQNNTLTNLSAANYLSTPGTQAGCGFNAGESLFIIFTVVGSTAAATYLWGNTDAAFLAGWSITLVTGALNVIQWHSSAPTGSIALNGIRKGVNWLVASMSEDGKTLRGSLNGIAFGEGAISAIAPPTGAQTHNLGGAPLGGHASWGTVGDIIACGKFGLDFAPQQVVSLSKGAVPTPPANRYQFPADLLAEGASALQWEWNQNYDIIPGSGTRGPDAFTWTPHGAPAVGVQGTQWFRSLAPYILDTQPVLYDSLAIPRTSSFAVLSFTMPIGQADMCVAVTCDDWQGANDDSLGYFVDGVFQDNIPSDSVGGQIANGETRYFWVPVSDGTATHQVTIVNGATIQESPALARSGGYFVEIVASFEQVFDGPTVNKRMVIAGDNPLYAIDSDTTSRVRYGVTTLVRATFPSAGGPGRVTSEGAIGQSLYAMYSALGLNSVALYAQQILEELKEGNPTTRYLYEFLGFNDYQQDLPWPSVAAFGAAKAALYDMLHATDPDLLIFAGNLLGPAYDAVPNIHGYTLSEFTAQIAALTTGRPWLTVIDPRPGVTYVVNNFDPDQAGLATLAANIQAGIGY